jgi:hypothetical protein
MVAVGLLNAKLFNPSQRTKSLASADITPVLVNLSSLEYADEKGILYQQQKKILTRSYKRLAIKM